MRPLKEDEMELVLEKLVKYVGNNLTKIIENEDNPYVFRLNKDRVHFVSAKLCKYSSCVPKKNLMSLGTCIGKFTKSKKFRLHSTVILWLAPYAVHKIWVKAAGEQAFIYGNHVIKRHLSRVTDNTNKNDGVVVFSMNDLPLGFGTAALGSSEMRSANTENIAVYHQSDVGEYLRDEVDLV